MNPRLKGVACPWRYGERMTDHIRDVRQHDGCPASDVGGRDAIGMASAATLDAIEECLRRSVGLRDVSALGTLPARVARVNEQNAYPGPFRLVLYEEAQLLERPARELSALLPSSPHPKADTLEVFKSDCPLRAFGKLNKLFADYVVGVAGESLLFAREFLESASSGVGALLLELLPEVPVAVPDRVNGSSATHVPVRVSGDVSHSEVNTDNVFGDERLRILDFTGGEQIELATPVHEVGFPEAGFKQLHLSLSGYERNALAGFVSSFASNGPDRDGGFVEVPAKDAVVVSDGAVRPEASLGPLVESVGIPDFGETPDHHLGRERKVGLHVLIAELLKRVLPKRSLLPRNLGDAVAGGVATLKRVFEDARLLLRRREFQSGHELHILKAYYDSGRSPMHYLWRGSHSFHPSTVWVFWEQLL